MSFTIILCYLSLLLFLGNFSGRVLKKSSGDIFLASRGIGPYMTCNTRQKMEARSRRKRGYNYTYCKRNRRG